MRDKILSFIAGWSLLSCDDNIAVAFSGGADSVMLLDFISKEYKNVCAVHINHLIREKEAFRDEAFAREFCRQRNIDFFCERTDVPSKKQKGESIEEAARRLRYEALERIAKENSITAILTAHHADDNAETVLFNLVRGSGGIKGIPPSRGIYKRPILCLTKKEILTYCRENNLNYVIDSTNNDTDYTRNFIRHKIMPELNRINPLSSEAILRACEISQKEDAFLDLSAEKAKNLNRTELARKDDVIICRAIRLLLSENRCEVGYKTLKTLCDCLKDGKNYHCADIGSNLFFVCDRDRFYVRGNDGKESDFIPELSVGIHNYNNMRIFFCDNTEISKEWIDKYSLSAYTYISKDRINGGISVRSRRDGDRYSYAGMTHKLKKLLCERNIPVEKRNLIPLFCDGDEIIWIPGFAPSSKFKKPDILKDKIIFLGIQY